MSEPKPFPANGDDNGAVPASASAPVALGSTNAEGDGPADGNAVGAAGGLPDGEHRRPNHGPGGKFVAGNQAARKGGLHARAEAPDGTADADTDTASAAQRLQVLRQLFDAISREARRYAEASRTHRLNARDQQQLLNMVERLSTIDGRIRELEPSATAGQTAETDAAEAVRKLARAFRNEPDLFSEFIQELLAADRLLAGPLHVALTQLVPEAVPKWRADPNDADEVVL
jgi:hypothetical protein